MILGALPLDVLAAQLPFTDVKPEDWFYDSVQYVYDNSLMNGIGKTSFDPYGTATRGMLVTILYRMEKSPAVSSSCPFADVESGSYYEKPVIWASKNGIVNGVSATEFAPNSNITREQMATILHRFAKYKSYDTESTVSLDSYTDAGQVGSWAEEPMKWAVGSNLITGVTETTLDPSGSANRAQVATILMRFCNRIDALKAFEEKDVDDFKGYEVINLDSSPDTNYAVLAKGAVRADGSENVNRLVSADEDSGVYTFADIDKIISGLKPGDILYYVNGDDYELIKVGTIELSNGGAVIQAAEGEVSDYFEYVDIDMGLDLATGADASSAELQDTELGSIDFGEGPIKGNVTLSMSLDFSFDRSSFIWNVEEVSTSFNADATVNATVKKDLLDIDYREDLEIPDVPVFYGVDLTIMPYVLLEADASVTGTFNAEAHAKIGARYANGDLLPVKESSSDASVKINGEFNSKLGIGLEMGIKILKVLSFNVNGEGGGTVDVKADFLDISANQEVKHLCRACFDGTVDAYCDLSANVKLCHKPLGKPLNLYGATKHLTDFYISLFSGSGNNFEMGKGDCPHKQYRLTVDVTDESGKPVEGADVTASRDNGPEIALGTTNSKGKVSNFLDNGVYTVTAKGSGGEASKQVEIKGKAVSEALTLKGAETETVYLRTKRTTGYEIIDNYIPPEGSGGRPSTDLFYADWRYGPRLGPEDLNYVGEGQSRTATYEYDKKGQLIREIDECNSETCTTEYSYDSKGNILSKRIFGIDSFGQNVDYSVDYTYDANGNMLTEDNPNESITYTYDSNGNCLSAIYTDKVYKTASIYEYTYDSDNKVLTEILKHDSPNDWNYNASYSYEYYSDGSVFKQTVKGVQHPLTYVYYDVTWTYNTEGYPISRTINYEESPGPQKVTIDYTYDSNGNIAKYTIHYLDEGCSEATRGRECLVTVTNEYQSFTITK